MKKEIHPGNHRPVIFEDTAAGARFLVLSTVKTEETDKWDDGNEYPKVSIEVSSASHPIYTGEERSLGKAGRVERFRARQAQAGK